MNIKRSLLTLLSILLFFTMTSGNALSSPFKAASGARFPHQVNPHTTISFKVNTTADTPDATPGNGVCSDGSGDCSLRAAIQEASAVVGTYSISFNLTAGSMIKLDNSYGTIDWTGSNITVDGTGVVPIISGANLTGGKSVFRIEGNSNTLEYVTIRDSNLDGVQVGDFAANGSGNDNVLTYLTIIHSAASGVYIHGSSTGGTNTQVSNSLIGINSSSTTACDSQYANAYDGIYIDGKAQNSALTSNEIVCNGHNGIFVNGTGGPISGISEGSSTIGTDGTHAMGNGWNGIHLINVSDSTFSANTISSNNQAGLTSDSLAGLWLDTSSQSNGIMNNKIGTDNSGSAGLGNLGDGIRLTGACGNTIGYNTGGNVISGNGGSGIYFGSASANNTVNNAMIGLNDAGSAAIPNAQAGIAVIGSDNNTVGSPSITMYVSGNTREGIYIQDSNGTLVGNAVRIGRGVPEVDTMGNGLQGIRVTGASTGSKLIPYAVLYNHAAGIVVDGASAVGNEFHANVDNDNNGIAYDLGYNGFTLNGTQSPPGPDNWEPYPVITSATDTSVSGTAPCAGCTIYVYDAISDPTATGGGGWALGSTTTTAGSTWTATIPSDVSPNHITAETCDGAGNCSELSPLYTGPVTHVVFLPLIMR